MLDPLSTPAGEIIPSNGFAANSAVDGYNSTSFPLLTLHNGCFEIDNSTLETFIACPRRFEYSSLRKRTPANDQPALNFGSAIHTAMEFRYKTFKNTPPPEGSEQQLFDLLAKYFEKNPQPEDDHRTLAFAQEVVKEYNARFQYEPFSLLVDENGKVQSEVSFSVEFGTYTNETGEPLYFKNKIDDFETSTLKLLVGQSIPIRYIGRIDLPVLWDGMFGPLDFKTASSLGPSKIDELKIAPQFEGYCWAMQKLTNQPVSFFAVRCLRSKAKPGKPKGTWSAWWDEAFLSHKEYLRPGQLDEWHANTTALIEEMLWHYSRQLMPQKKKACTLYGKCPYYDLCYLSPEQRVPMLRSTQYQDNNWSPLKD